MYAFHFISFRFTSDALFCPRCLRIRLRLRLQVYARGPGLDLQFPVAPPSPSSSRLFPVSTPPLLSRLSRLSSAPVPVFVVRDRPSTPDISLHTSLPLHALPKLSPSSSPPMHSSRSLSLSLSLHGTFLYLLRDACDLVYLYLRCLMTRYLQNLASTHSLSSIDSVAQFLEINTSYIKYQIIEMLLQELFE